MSKMHLPQRSLWTTFSRLRMRNSLRVRLLNLPFPILNIGALRLPINGVGNIFFKILICWKPPLWVFGRSLGLWKVTKSSTSPIWGSLSLDHVQTGICVLKTLICNFYSAQYPSNITAVQLLQRSKVAMRFQPASERSTTWSSNTPPREDMRLLFRSANRWKGGCGKPQKISPPGPVTSHMNLYCRNCAAYQHVRM